MDLYVALSKSAPMSINGQSDISLLLIASTIPAVRECKAVSVDLPACSCLICSAFDFICEENTRPILLVCMK